MNWTGIFSFTAAFIISLGGGGVIVLGLSNWIGRLLADRYVEKLKQEIQQEIESHKTRLRKSEFLFQKEFDAASEFMALRRSLIPRYWFPEMEWDDACEDFAHRFNKATKQLENFVGTHGAALDGGTLEKLSVAIGKADAGKFEVKQNTVTSEGIKTAGEVLNELEQIENELHESVRSQSSPS